MMLAVRTVEEPEIIIAGLTVTDMAVGYGAWPGMHWPQARDGEASARPTATSGRILRKVRNSFHLYEGFTGFSLQWVQMNN
jgi:hypothetical protein